MGSINTGDLREIVDFRLLEERQGLGKRSIGKAFERHGHQVFSVDWDKQFPDIDCYEDISKLSASDLKKMMGGISPDIIWASPDCTTYSVAAIGYHRKKNPITKELEPVTKYAQFCDNLNRHVIDRIKELNPTYWFIENPRGGLRKMSFMQDFPRYTVTYCQYGDVRMKPTDLWTNHPNPNFKPPCAKRSPCHQSAPRGSKSGTQGMKCSRDKAVIPDELCEHIVEICEGITDTPPVYGQLRLFT